MNIRAMMGYLLILFYVVCFELVLCIIILITLNAWNLSHLDEQCDWAADPILCLFELQWYPRLLLWHCKYDSCESTITKITIFFFYPRNIQHCTLLCHLFVLSAVMYKVMWNELSFCYVSLSVLPSLATCVQTLIFYYWLDSDQSFYNIPQVKRMRETLYSSLLLQVLKYAVICTYQAS